MSDDDTSTCIVVSGQIASGKTTLAQNLAASHGYTYLAVRNALEEILGGENWSRARLQKEGASLDRRTNGRWLLHFLQRAMETSEFLVVDSGRTRRQVEPILEAVTDARLVFLEASEESRRRRYRVAANADPLKANVSFDEAMDHDTERRATDLRSMAHGVIVTDGLQPWVVLQEVEAALGLA